MLTYLDSLLLFGTVIGIGATIIIDLWAMALTKIFAIPSLNFSLVGRWLCHMRKGVYVHDAIANAERCRFEAVLGWMVHYLIGAVFGILFLTMKSINWLENPTFIDAVLFGLVTVLCPWFILQPGLGMGFAASKTQTPWQARVKSLMTHCIFGLGLFVSALLLTLGVA